MENQRKERKSFRKVFLLIPMLLLSIATLSVVTYAFWNSLQTSKKVEVPIGDGVEIVVNLSSQTSKSLVPLGQALQPGQTESVVITYNVILSEETVNALDLSVSYSDVKINDSTLNTGLVNINIDPEATTINNSNVVVTVTVTLTEPADQAQYDAIKNQPITFTLTFTATPQPQPQP